MTPIKFSSFGGYRRFCSSWWKDLWRTITVGWIYDVQAYWHRARYGWAPKDTWSLDDHLARVMAGSLAHLANHTHGTPPGYPETGDITFETPTDHGAWRDDLHRWAYAFERYATDDYIELYVKKGKPTDYDAWHADEAKRRETIHKALQEIEPWFGALWD